MNGIISKILFPTASRAVNTRNIFTKEYLDLTFFQEKQNESRAKAGKDAVKIKNNFLRSYKQKGIKDLRINDIKNFMGLVEGEKDMTNLYRVVEDSLAQAGDPKHKTQLLCNCIQTCYLRGDLKYSRLLSEGAFFQYFDKSPIAQNAQFQFGYDTGRYH